MARLAVWARRCGFLNRHRFEAARRAGMRAHREQMPDPRPFGNETRLHEAAMDVWGWRWLDDLGRDLQYGLSALRRAPGAAFVIVASFALAAGATTAIFSVVNGVLLRPLPFGEPQQLVDEGRRGRLAVVARLRPGRTLETGLAELQVIAARVERQAPSPEMRVGVRLAPLDTTVTAGARRSLWLLLAAVGLVLAAACANVANLLLARTSPCCPQAPRRCASRGSIPR